MANEGGTPGVINGRGRTVGRIDYKLQKEKDRGTNEQSVADFSQAAHFQKSPRRSRNRQNKKLQKEPRTKRVFERSKRAANGHPAYSVRKASLRARLFFAFSFFRVFVILFDGCPIANQ
jgi:hypothetical protein